MRVYWKQPQPEVRIVRPDNEGEHYEIWVLTPQCIGSVHRTGTARVLADGIPHSNINAAARHLLEKSGHSSLAGGMQMSVRAARDVFAMSGLDLVERNAWMKFCAQRKINPRSTSEMNRTYQLTKKELEELGIQAG